MNAEALRMYRCSDIEEAQQNIGKILKKLYYPDPDTVSRLTRLREVNDMVDYECIIHKGTEQECHIMAKTKIFMTPAGGLCDLPDTDKRPRDWYQQGISPTSVRKVLTGTEFGRERNHGYRTWTVDCKITGRSDGRKYFG